MALDAHLQGNIRVLIVEELDRVCDVLLPDESVRSLRASHKVSLDGDHAGASRRIFDRWREQVGHCGEGAPAVKEEKRPNLCCVPNA